MTAPIIGATKIEHLETAIAAGDLKLGDEEIRQLESALSTACRKGIRLNRKGRRRMAASVYERVEYLLKQHGISLPLGSVTLTPFAVDHGPEAPGALGFVLQHGHRRIVIMGDFLHVSDENNPLLFDADVMFLDANTWHPADWTWHQSVLGNLRLIEKWRPRRAYMIHYSGYEDREHANEPVSSPMGRQRFEGRTSTNRGRSGPSTPVARDDPG